MSKLYKAFHDAEPIRRRKVSFKLPKSWWLMGEATQVNYAPRYPSRYEGTEFEHRFGDRGRGAPRGVALPLVIASDDGGMILIIRGKSKYKVTKRGIIG